MPRATSEKLSKVSAKSAAAPKASTSKAESTGSRNALFNTADLGQHILKNPLVAQAIVDKASLKSSDIVLEVGPGTGNLTVRILEQCKRCTAIEMDPRMAAEVAKRVQGKPEGKKLNVINGDFMKAELDYFDVCISNTPYQISSPLLFKLLSHRPLPRVFILMFQREFAQRLLARPGDKLWSRLSANIQLYAKVDLVLKVSRNSFRPPPQVDSSVVRVAPLDPPPPVRFEEFDGLTRILFNRRNKSLRANFQATGVKELLEHNRQPSAHAQDATIDELIDKILGGDREGVRAAKMDVDDLLELLREFHQYGLHFS